LVHELIIRRKNIIFRCFEVWHEDRWTYDYKLLPSGGISVMQGNFTQRLRWLIDFCLQLDEGSRANIQAAFWPLIVCLFFLFFTVRSYSFETSTLPKNISTSSMKMGHIEGLDQRYQEDGELVKLKDYKSIEFDAPTLAKFNPRAATLVQTLNRFGLYNAGDLFNLGTLEIETKPTIDYMAPVYARGLTDSWTLGVGIPVIQYTNEVKMTQSLSNVDYYNQFRGLSPDLDAALDTDLRAATQNVLTQKGYDPIENRSESFIGDIQVVSLWKIFDRGDAKLIHQATLGLPTGPEYNPDDLLALNTFHKTSLDNLIGYSKIMGPLATISPYFNMRYVFPESITVRVPTNEEDVLPDQSQKDGVTRQEGMTYEIGTKLDFAITDSFLVGTDYRVGQKDADKYSGSAKGDTSVLAKNSKSMWHKVSLHLNYSTVKSYLKKQSLLPMSITVMAYDTVMGKNVERRTGQEISLALFF
jgi:hypothetical protein